MTIGSMEYYSPELGRYIISDSPDDARQVRCGSDVFALGVLFHEYITGAYPAISCGKYPYQARFVSDIVLKPMSGAMTALLQSMLALDPKARKDALNVLDSLDTMCGVKSGVHRSERPVYVRFVDAGNGKCDATLSDGSVLQVDMFVAKAVSKRVGLTIESS